MLLIVICVSPRAENNLSLEAVFIERVCIHSYVASLHLCFQLPHHTYIPDRTTGLFPGSFFPHLGIETDLIDINTNSLLFITYTILLSARPPEPPGGVVSLT